MIKITCNFSREKNNDRKILIKHVLHVIYAAANTFFQLTLVFTADGHNGFCFDSFFE